MNNKKIAFFTIMVCLNSGCAFSKKGPATPSSTQDIFCRFAESPASDPDYLRMLKSRDRVEVSKHTILFKGDGSVSSMIVAFDKDESLQACQHINFDIPTDGYYKITSGKWRQCGSKEWDEMLNLHQMYFRANLR